MHETSNKIRSFGIKEKVTVAEERDMMTLVGIAVCLAFNDSVSNDTRKLEQLQQRVIEFTNSRNI
jgi:secreted protein with Ig-like and vWFA domain